MCLSPFSTVCDLILSKSDVRIKQYSQAQDLKRCCQPLVHRVGWGCCIERNTMMRLFHILLICEILLCPLTCLLVVSGSGADTTNAQKAACCSRCAERRSDESPENPNQQTDICQCFCSQAYTVQTVEQQSLDAEIGTVSHLLDTANILPVRVSDEASSLHFPGETHALPSADGRAMRLRISSLTC